MMIAGCFGLLAATAEVCLSLAEPISGRCEAGAASRRGIIHPKGVNMKQHLTFGHVGVDDFKMSYDFYTSILDWKPSRVQVMMMLPSFRQAELYWRSFPREKLAEDAMVLLKGVGFQGSLWHTTPAKRSRSGCHHRRFEIKRREDCEGTAKGFLGRIQFVFCRPRWRFCNLGGGVQSVLPVR
jgi:hypothetical protein